MRTNLIKSAATPRSWFFTLIAVCTCVPGVSGQGPNDHGNAGDSAFYGPGSRMSYSEFDLAQDAPNKNGTAPAGTDGELDHAAGGFRRRHGQPDS